MYLPKSYKSEKWKKKKRKKKKKRNWILLITIISTVPKVLFFKTTDLYIVYLFSEYADNYNIINLG